MCFLSETDERAPYTSLRNKVWVPAGWLDNSSELWVGTQIVHELAYVIDWHSRIQTGVTSVYDNPVPTYGRFSDAWTGASLTDYAAGNEFRPYPRKWEVWAEAVTVWVFGNNYAPKDRNRNVTAVDLGHQMTRMGEILNGWR